MTKYELSKEIKRLEYLFFVAKVTTSEFLSELEHAEKKLHALHWRELHMQQHYECVPGALVQEIRRLNSRIGHLNRALQHWRDQQDSYFHELDLLTSSQPTSSNN